MLPLEYYANSDKPDEVSGSKCFDWSAEEADFQFYTRILSTKFVFLNPQTHRIY